MKKDLIMVIEDVFYITGRGIIVCGQIQNEKVEVGQKIVVDPEFLPEIQTEIKSIEVFRKMIKVANQNDNVGLLLDGLTKKQIKKKMKLYSVE
jgi:elongation factor Tu